MKSAPISDATHDAVCTPFVIASMGTSSTGSSGHSPCHMRRDTSPWSWLTPL